MTGGFCAGSGLQAAPRHLAKCGAHGAGAELWLVASKGAEKNLVGIRGGARRMEITHHPHFHFTMEARRCLLEVGGGCTF